MKTKTTWVIVRAGMLMAPLSMAACGGGGPPPNCSGINASICANVQPSSTNTATAVNANAVLLFSTAPSAVTLNAGATATYTVGGGTQPYTTTSGNTNVGTVTMSGTTLSLTGVASGTSPIVVVDAVGKAINIALTVLAQGQQGTALSIAPGAITTGDCTTNIPFFFNGGVAPYRLFTSNNFQVPISSALSSAGRAYFTASVKYDGAPVTLPHTETLTVLDSQSRTATVNIVVTTSQSCASNPLLIALPASASMRVTEILTFQLSGGAAGTSAHAFSFTDNESMTRTPTSTVVEVVPGTNGATSFNIRALSLGKTLITVTDPIDGQNVNITVSVF